MIKLIADVEHEDGTKSYGITLGYYDTEQEALDAKKNYNESEGPDQYMNFDTQDEEEEFYDLYDDEDMENDEDDSTYVDFDSEDN